ncbi:uncharacterized protein SCHCODRAFT_02644633 [Schizophyllum commune H4-8]|uniref:Uncharacterized protein n=1 Tax=Schizophyllum commune (strain H4-8 / FGSC 9210) TaxID=578458 RepID=D8QKX5_SCHCM|nr:uncharacterized protein SCHCODRAFT_02644633 [Schizophyllum commune H4-8]KAI5885392.1 hypothetical protein SCHCODRAFT_02644633 [Schizophyllum commune H4-8]
MANNQEMKHPAAAVKVGGQRHFMSRRPRPASTAPRTEVPEVAEPVSDAFDDYPRPTPNHEQQQEHPRHDEVPKKARQERHFEQPRWNAKQAMNAMPRNAGAFATGARIAQPASKMAM